MKKKNLIHSFPIALGILLLFSSCGDDKSTQQAQGAQQAPTLPVATIPTKTVASFTTYPASIEGIVNSQVNAKISGYITDVLVDEGQKVKKGQTLFRLETQALSQDAAAARANVNAAQVEVDKLKPLVEKNIISNVQLETANAKLQQAISGYNSIAANIDYGNIKSPVDGYVGSINLRKGALVSPSSQIPMTTVADISKVYAYFSMNEKEYLDFIQNSEGKDIEEKIKKLPKVRLLLANGSIYDQEGTIDSINSQVNTNTGSISFRAIFDNPSRILTNGNSGKIQIPIVYENAIVIPQEATYEQQGNVMAFKLNQNNTVSLTMIKVKARIDNLYVVESGIDEGDKIVVTGVGKLRNDMPITPQEVVYDSIVVPIKVLFKN